MLSSLLYGNIHPGCLAHMEIENRETISFFREISLHFKNGRQPLSKKHPSRPMA
jgi:hypothetical protein